VRAFLEVNNLVHKRQLEHIMKKLNPVQISTINYFPKIHFNIILYSTHSTRYNRLYILHIHAVSATYFPDDFTDVNNTLKSPTGLYVEIIPVQKQILQNLGYFHGLSRSFGDIRTNINLPYFYRMF
jgi:hypothetical protein